VTSAVTLTRWLWLPLTQVANVLYSWLMTHTLVAIVLALIGLAGGHIILRETRAPLEALMARVKKDA
jgi:hypothetical protein